MPKLDDKRKIIILNYINEYYEQRNHTPAVRDISAGTGIPVTSVQRYLVALRESGALDYNGRRSIGTTRIKKSTNTLLFLFSAVSLVAPVITRKKTSSNISVYRYRSCARVIILR